MLPHFLLSRPYILMREAGKNYSSAVKVFYQKKFYLCHWWKVFVLWYIHFLILIFAWPNHLWDDIKYNFFWSDYYCCSTLHTHDKKQGFELERSFLGNQPWYETKKRIITISYLNNNSDKKTKHSSMHFIPHQFFFFKFT